MALDRLGNGVDSATLERVSNRVLWLAASIVHHANRVRPNESGVKVGGHQGSSASMVTLMTALWFGFLQRDDRVSVKPHASPVLHAINYLIGELDERYLESLRQFRGLQSYPSRIKDPDPVDFSTGSVGLGASAPIWSAIANRYVSDHFGARRAGRQIALIGDAELDEGACWEAIVDPQVTKLGEVLWIVDVNRQSLDRVIPDRAIERIERMFVAAGWHVVTLKYGSRLERAFAQDGGDALRARLDSIGNEEYQRLLRSSGSDLRERLALGDTKLSRLLERFDDDELSALLRDLGGHDFEALFGAFEEVDAVSDRPSVIFAYTIKGYKLPTEGHPANHSALLNADQWRELAGDLHADADNPWAAFSLTSVEGQLCKQVGERLRCDRSTAAEKSSVVFPRDVGRKHSGKASTQQAFGRFFVDLVREAPEVAARVVTVAPDVGTSTQLGGWINKVGIWSASERRDWFADDTDTLVRWHEGPSGQHIELGIAEVNLVSLLGELGATWSRDGEALLPIGTVYDPFVGRALEPWSFGIYGGGQSILVGTPSGVTLGPEGGAHQSIITPSIGIEQPGCVSWEPAFGQDFEWTFMHALGQLGRADGSSAYFRLSTRPLDQGLAAVPVDDDARELRRRDVLNGGYRLRPVDSPAVVIAAVGAMVPEALGAADLLSAEAGVEVEVVCVTSADLLFRGLQARAGLSDGDPAFVERLFRHNVPIVSVIDGHPHTLSFLGSIRSVPNTCLGVTQFGQSGDIADLYRLHGIDAESIVGAALDLGVSVD